MGTEELPNASARPIAHDRAAGLSTRGDAQAAHFTIPCAREHHHVPSHHLDAIGVDTLKLRAS